LCTGITLAILRQFGTAPVVRDRLKICVSGSIIAFKHDLRSLGPILSDPGAFPF